MTNQLTHKERLNIGYDGISSASDLAQDLHDYEQDIREWFSENHSECQIELHHEPSKELGCCLYYLDIMMSPEFSPSFRNYFM